MNNAKFFLIAFLIMQVFAGSVFSQVKYKPDKFSNAKRKHKSMVEVNSENLLRYDVKKLQIIECTGEFQASDAFLASGFENKDFASYFKNAHGSKIGDEIGENYPETVCNAVYKLNQKILFENGLKNVNKQTIVDNPVYRELKLSREAAPVYTGSKIDVDEKEITVSTTKMNALPVGLSYDEKEEFYQNLASIGNDTESAAELKIHFKVKVNETGNPVLTEYSVLMDTWISSFKKGKKTIYKWKVIDSPLFSLKKELAGNADVMNGSGTIDMQRFDQELINMLKDITEMFSYALSDQFIKYQ
jgi:hypothetical protein